MDQNLPRDLEVPATVGYELQAYDGGLESLGSYWAEFPIPGVHCRRCLSTLDFEYVSRSAAVEGVWDVIDIQGRCIVGDRFRQFCLSNGFADVELPCVDAARGYYELRPTRILEVDLSRSEPLLRDFCSVCGNFESYVNGRGLFLTDVTHPLPHGIYRTDLIVGCGIGKHPRIIVAPETAGKMDSLRLSRMELRPVPYIDPNFDRRKAEIDSAYTHLRNQR